MSAQLNNDLPPEPADLHYRGKRVTIERGATIEELMRRHPDPQDETVFAAVMNNRVVSLKTPILRSGRIEPVHYRSRHGVRIFRNHLTLMLCEVFYRQHPGCSIRVGQAISEGYYFEIAGVDVNTEFVDELKRGLDQLVTDQQPFILRLVPVEEARRLFYHKGSLVKRQILDNWPSAHVSIVQLGRFVEFCFGPVAPHTGMFSGFKLFGLNGDLVLQFPDPGHPEVRRNDGPQPKLYQTLKKSRKWGEVLGVSHVGELNQACIDGSINEVLKVAEGLHEKMISDIADDIARVPDRRLIFIAGPSAAGKTTFSKRLSIQLKVNGLQPVSLSLDNYYVDREKTPRDKSGAFDFEALEAIDLELFNEHLRQILNGEEVLTPRYDFARGHRADPHKWIKVRLNSNQIVMIEGIHGLNNALTPSVKAAEKYRIYINALNPLSIDEHNRIHTSDTRLIRRIVRDRHYRGYLAAETINTWDSVRRGEREHIFPFQELADIIFDSSLIYEFSVLKIFAERYLLEVPRSDPAYAEAYRLRRFLAMFVPMLPGDVPQTSLLREFIGGSSFAY